MPLPSNGSLSLQGHSRPGEGFTAKPKQAMLVRMSEETLDALQNLASEERMDFEFGDNPGIYIRDVFFPMRAHRETTVHELFIRTTSALRPTGPLKLNANVVGRFDVDRVLSEKLTKQIHESSLAAEKKKKSRGVVVLEAPPVEATGAKKKRAPPKSTQRITSVAMNKSAVPSRVASPLPPPLPSSQRSTTASSASTSQLPSASSSTSHRDPIRARLIHFLALGPQPTNEVVNFIGGTTMDHSLREKIMQLLSEIAEQEPSPKKPVKQSGLSDDLRSWTLRRETWRDVRPRQYADYTEAERLKVTRHARMKFADMKIPESDPAWEHVKFRANGSTQRPSVGGNTAASTTNGSSAGAPLKDKKAKAKPAPEIKARSEVNVEASSSRVVSATALRVSTVESSYGKDKEDGELSATPPRSVPARRLPGSRPAGPSTAVATAPQPAASGPPKKRVGIVDVRSAKKEMPAPSGSARPVPPLPPPAPLEKKIPPAMKAVQREKVSAREVNRGREQRERERERVPAAGSKRKQASYDYSDSESEGSAPPRSDQKRKKIEGNGRLKEESRWLDAPVAKKAVKKESSPQPPLKKKDLSPLPPVKMKKDVSPMPPSRKMKRDVSPQPEKYATLPSEAKTGPSPDLLSRSQGASSSRHERSVSSSSTRKPRRKSPIYTSDEEDQEDARPSGKVTSDASNSQREGHVVRPRASAASSMALPSDHAGLRSRYQATYMEYIGVFQKVVAQKNKIETVLKRGGSGGTTDSEGDVEMMSAEELERLSARYRSLQEELESIRVAYNG